MRLKRADIINIILIVGALWVLGSAIAHADSPADCRSVAPTEHLQTVLDTGPACISLQPDAVYTITEPLFVRQPLAIVGNGATLNADGWTRRGPAHQHAAMLSTNRGGPVVISDLVIDGAAAASYGIGPKNYTLDGVTVKNTVCSALAVAGPGVIVRNSVLMHNGYGCIEYSGLELGAAIYGAYQGDSGSCFGPVIENNVITDSHGPALDMDGVWCGVVTGNFIYANDGWAGISLYGGSFWTIKDNVVSHPVIRNDLPNGPFHPHCASPTAPIGSMSAAVYICQDTDALAHWSVVNTVSGNWLSSGYGILLVGADEVSRTAVPRFITLTNNSTLGSLWGCADDYNPKWRRLRNAWTGNWCGTPGGPARF